MTESDALKILNLQDDCSAADVRQAYVDLVKVWHPDRFTGDRRLQAKAERTLQDINEAYDLLRDGPTVREADRSPFTPGEPGAAPAPAGASVGPRAERTDVPLLRLVLTGVAVGLAVVALATLVLFPVGGDRAESSAAADTLSDAPAAAPPAVEPAPVAPSGPATATSDTRPQSGIEIIAPRRTGGGSLVVYNRAQRDAVVALAAANAYERAVYVRAGEQVSIANVAAGTYRVLMTVGRDWTADRFARNASYQELVEPARFVERTDNRGTEYTRLTVSVRSPVRNQRGIRTTTPFRVAAQ